MHYTKLNLSLTIDPDIGSFINSVLDTADKDKTIEPFSHERLNEYYLASHDVLVLKYTNPNGTAYYGVRGNRLLKYFTNWTDIRDLLVAKNITWQLGEPPEFPEMVCNNYGSTPHYDLARNTGLNFIVHEDLKVPFSFYNNDKIVEECYHDNKGVLFNAKTIHGTGVFEEKNVRAVVSLCIMDDFESMKEKLKEFIITE